MIEETGNSEKLTRITTGNVQLDTILGGGFPANSINILMGEPGSGKTILAERLVFANADASGRPILYLTTLSEPLEKVVRYLQQFEFYDEDKLASGAVLYQSLGPDLEKHGVAAVVPRLKEIIKTIGPKIIVIDSFKAIHDLSTSLPEMRRMLYEVSGLLTAYDTTAILLGEYSEDMISTLPEFAVADAMIELARMKRSTRDERYLRVLKLRGSAYQEGLHAFRISPRGLDVFPRLTSPQQPPVYDRSDEARLSTGVAGLDKLLNGGLRTGSCTILQGASGAGKSTLALQFVLDGLARGEAGLYVNFQENPTQLARSVASLGWSLDDARANGLHLLYTSPVELQIDTIVTELFEVVTRHGVKRIVIDALGDLVYGANEISRVTGYLYALAQHFQVQRATTVMTLETTMEDAAFLAGHVSAVCDNVLALGVERTATRSRRTVHVVKARATEHDLDLHELRITAHGITVD